MPFTSQPRGTIAKIYLSYLEWVKVNLNVPHVNDTLDEQKNGYVAKDTFLHVYMHYSEDLA